MIRETIIRKIVELDMAGRSLLRERIQASDELLHASALNEFGSWETRSSTRASARTTLGGVATCRQSGSNSDSGDSVRLATT
jgi:hypothetical protein